MLHELSVPSEKIELFHSLLCLNKGHYCSIPKQEQSVIKVQIEITGDSDFFSICANLSILDRRTKPRNFMQRSRYWISHLIHPGK